MGTWSIIAIVYLAIGFVHLTAHTTMVLRAISATPPKDFGDPMDVVVVTFAWPIFDVLWLKKVLSDSTEDQNSQRNTCIKCGDDIAEGRTVCSAMECGGNPLDTITQEENEDYD